MTFVRLSREWIGMLLVGLFVFLLFFVDFTSLSSLQAKIPSEWLNVNTIFLSIFFEAVPFILLGVFISAIIQVFVTEEMIHKVLPKSPVVAVIPAAFVGVIFPMCECVIIPVVRRLMKKGLPLHVAMVILVSAPILNPVVFLSTYYAFRTNETILYSRFGIALLVALCIGFFMYVLYRGQNVLKEENIHVPEHQKKSWKDVANHAADEFFDTGKFLLIGAFLASLFQTFLDRQLLEVVANNEVVSPVVMMGFAYVLSLCSEADAFIAASFGQIFSAKALTAFLVFGPMLDLKNTLMLFAYFKKGFVFTFIFIVTALVYVIVQFSMGR
ncbi:permease [Bacillus manliponensis]|uniref:permease n=1 Tax=Bacillus manliponensis TaxID=574376 RepID=UPI00351265BE